MLSWLRRRRAGSPEALTTALAEVGRLADEGALSDALTACERLTVRWPNEPSGWLEAGRLRLALGRPSEAVPALRRAAELEPREVLPLRLLGQALDEVGAHAEAATTFGTLLALDAADAETWRRRGAALRHLQQLPEALECLQQAVALAPDSADARYDLAFTAVACGQDRLALDHFLHYRETAPPDHPRRDAAERVIGLLQARVGGEENTGSCV